MVLRLSTCPVADPRSISWMVPLPLSTVTSTTITASTVTNGVRLKPSSRNASAGACGCMIRPIAETMPVKAPMPRTSVAASPSSVGERREHAEAKEDGRSNCHQPFAGPDGIAGRHPERRTA